MKSRISLFLSLIVGVGALAFIPIQAEAGRQFFANFDNKGFPNNSVNDVKNWVPKNPAQKWGIKAAFDGDALWHTTAGCASSGDTPLPINAKVMESWQDYIVRMDVAWVDDDSVGIFFRQTAEDKGYFAFFGYNETARVILMDLAKGCGKVGLCLSEGANCEAGGDLVIAEKPNGGPGLDQSGKVVYRCEVEVRGDRIKISFGKLKQVKTLIDVKDDTYKRGGVGIWQESCDNCLFDNIEVDVGAAVDPTSKLATQWSVIKTSRY